MPDPFRHYEGVPLVDIPADPPSPAIPALDVVLGAGGRESAGDGAQLLSQLLFYSAAISASKRVPSSGYRYALRVNPSSGNLHPTEFHFVARGLVTWQDGLYHYRAASHMAEQRAVGELALGIFDRSPLVFVLTTIAWREAWKYRERAYRYCLHDMGHAREALSLAARAIGCDVEWTSDFDDDAIAAACRLHPDEWPMLIGGFRPPAVVVTKPEVRATTWFGGTANELSKEPLVYAAIEEVHQATKARVTRTSNVNVSPCDGLKLPSPVSSNRPFGEVVRTRRSALDFVGGTQTISLAQLSAIMAAAGARSDGRITFYLYAHRVEGLDTGVYRYCREHGEVELLKAGDQTVVAAGLSLGQDLAGNACVAFSMVADLDRGYREAFFEAGAAGQRLYIAAESLGLRATGIGAFFDDRVHEYLGLTPADGQVIYHFAIGHPVVDPRLDA